MAKIGKPRTSKGLATFTAKIADEKLAEDIVVMDLTDIETAPTDYFMICTCNSDVQVESVTNSILRKCKEVGIEKPKSEGLESKEWVLLDFFNVVVHIMINNSREFYKIEKLWADAKFFKLNESGELRKQKDINFFSESLN